jgi:hypothetical protein
MYHDTSAKDPNASEHDKNRNGTASPVVESGAGEITDTARGETSPPWAPRAAATFPDRSVFYRVLDTPQFLVAVTIPHSGKRRRLDVWMFGPGGDRVVFLNRQWNRLRSAGAVIREPVTPGEHALETSVLRGEITPQTALKQLLRWRLAPQAFGVSVRPGPPETGPPEIGGVGFEDGRPQSERSGA